MKSVSGIAILLCLLLAGCTQNDVGCIDYGPIQIGCRLPDIPRKPQETPDKRQENHDDRGVHFRFGFPWWISDRDNRNASTVNGMIFSPLIDIDSGTLNGVVISTFLMHDKVNGVVIAPLLNMTKETNGLSLSCWNWSSDRAVVQAGLINFCEFLTAPGEVDLQIGFLNEAGLPAFQVGAINNSWVDAWLQLGFLNTVIKPDKFTLHGEEKRPSVQIGLYNHARGNLQIGLLNRNERGWLWHYSPLINFSAGGK